MKEVILPALCMCVVPFLLLFSQFPQRLSACLTQATKDPDPFHQLFEQRKGDLSFVWCLIWWECVVEYIVVHMMEYVVVPKVMKYLTKHSRCLDVITGLVCRWSATDDSSLSLRCYDCQLWNNKNQTRHIIVAMPDSFLHTASHVFCRKAAGVNYQRPGQDRVVPSLLFQSLWCRRQRAVTVTGQEPILSFIFRKWQSPAVLLTDLQWAERFWRRASSLVDQFFRQRQDGRRGWGSHL